MEGIQTISIDGVLVELFLCHWLIEKNLVPKADESWRWKQGKGCGIWMRRSKNMDWGKYAENEVSPETSLVDDYFM